MGGNAKYRTATYVDMDGTRKAVRDSNGNIIRVGVGPQVGRGQRTNTTASNAKERMLNGQAIKQIRDLAKKYRQSVKNGETDISSITRLAIIAQKVTTDDVLYNVIDNTILDDIPVGGGKWKKGVGIVEAILGVKLQ